MDGVNLSGRTLRAEINLGKPIVRRVISDGCMKDITAGPNLVSTEIRHLQLSCIDIPA